MSFHEIGRSPEGEQQPEITLQPGLRAYPVDVRKPITTSQEAIKWHEKDIPTEQQATARLNRLLSSIEEQGGQLRGIVPVQITPPFIEGYGTGSPETRSYFIIDTPKGESRDYRLPDVTRRPIPPHPPAGR